MPHRQNHDHPDIRNLHQGPGHQPGRDGDANCHCGGEEAGKKKALASAANDKVVSTAVSGSRVTRATRRALAEAGVEEEPEESVVVNCARGAAFD